MRRISLVLSVLIALGVSLTTPATAADGFPTFTTCSALEDDPIPDNVCYEGNAIGAVLISKLDRVVRYKVCVDRPNTPKECFTKRARGRGEPSSIWTNPDYQRPGWLGTYRFQWRVPGRGVIDRDRLVLRSEGV